MAIMNQLDALSAKEGTVFFTINDKQYELAELISLEVFVVSKIVTDKTFEFQPH